MKKNQSRGRAEIAAEEAPKSKPRRASRPSAPRRTRPRRSLKREQERVSRHPRRRHRVQGRSSSPPSSSRTRSATVETFKARLLEKQRGTHQAARHRATCRRPYGEAARVRYQYGKLQGLPRPAGRGRRRDEGRGSGVPLRHVARRGGVPQAVGEKWCREHGIPMLMRDPRDHAGPRDERERALRRRRARAGRDGSGDHHAARPVRRRAAARARAPDGSDTLKIPRRTQRRHRVLLPGRRRRRHHRVRQGLGQRAPVDEEARRARQGLADLIEDAVISVVDDWRRRWPTPSRSRKTSACSSATAPRPTAASAASTR
jgi:hypothetical protein